MATDPKPCATLDTMWKAFSDLYHKKTPAVKGENSFLCLCRERGHPPRRGRGPPVIGTVRAECRPIRLHGGRDRAIIRCSLMIPLSFGLIKHPTAGLYRNSLMPTCSPSVPLLRPTTPPVWSGLLSPSTRAAALRESRGRCLNCHEDTHSLRNCRYPFINASDCFNPELGQHGDDDAYRRWQARMTSYHRDGKSSRAYNHTENRRNRSGESLRYGPGPGKQPQR